LTAQKQYEASQAQYLENKTSLEKQAAAVQASADAERRKAAEQQASALKARTRGGRRALLSQERLDAELGLAPMLGQGQMVQ
jgi:hypothetical protein